MRQNEATSIMTNQSATPENAISRRHFLFSASLATTALGLKPLTGMGGAGACGSCPGVRPGKTVPVV